MPFFNIQWDNFKKCHRL